MFTLERRRATAGAVLAIFVIVMFSSCFGAVGAPDPPTIDDIQVVEFNETALLGISGSADPAAGYAYGLIFTANLFQLLAVTYTQIALEGWDETQAATYTDETGLYTISWDQSGNTWTWTFEYTDGMDTYSTVIAVTAESDGWSVVVSQDGVVFLDGTFGSDGSAGQVTIFPDDSGERLVAEWGPSSLGGYDQTYTVGYYGAGGTVNEELVAHYTNDGTSGQWTYTDYTDVSPDGSGTWSP